MKAGFCGTKRKFLTGIAVTIAGVLLSIASLPTRAGAEPIRLGAPPQLTSGLVYMADNQGFFKKQGIDVVIKEYEAGVQAVTDLIAGKIDIAVSAEFVFVLQSFKHPDLRLLATISMSSNHDLVVRKDRSIAQPQDLRGKRIAVTKGSSGEFFLYNYLIFNRIPTASIPVVYYSPLEIVKAMADGTIDAALSWQPYTSQMMKQMGAKTVSWPAQSGQDNYLVVCASSQFVKKNTKSVEKFLTALKEAENFIIKNPDRTRTILSNRLKIDPESLAEAWSRSHLQLQLTQDLLVLMEREAKWAIRNKVVEKKEAPNYLNFFYFDALDKVKPEAVSIVH